MTAWRRKKSGRKVRGQLTGAGDRVRRRFVVHHRHSPRISTFYSLCKCAKRRCGTSTRGSKKAFVATSARKRQGIIRDGNGNGNGCLFLICCSEMQDIWIQRVLAVPPSLDEIDGFQPAILIALGSYEMGCLPLWTNQSRRSDIRSRFDDWERFKERNQMVGTDL